MLISFTTELYCVIMWLDTSDSLSHELTSKHTSNEPITKSQINQRNVIYTMLNKSEQDKPGSEIYQIYLLRQINITTN